MLILQGVSTPGGIKYG